MPDTDYSTDFYGSAGALYDSPDLDLGADDDDLDGWSAVAFHLGTGFAEGLTTWDSSEFFGLGKADTTAEQIAHMTGAALGLVGFLPSTALKGGLFAGRGLLKLFGAGKLAARGRRVEQAARIAQPLQLRSVPMAVGNRLANALSSGASKAVAARESGRALSGTAKAAAAASDFLAAGTVRRVVAREAVEVGAMRATMEAAGGAFNEGEWGLTEIAGNAMHGATLGAADGLGFALVNSALGRFAGGLLSQASPEARNLGLTAVRSFANASWAMGFSAAEAKAMGHEIDTPGMVFEGVLGAAFGIVDMPADYRAAQSWMRKSPARLANPEADPTYGDLSPSVKREVMWERDAWVAGIANRSSPDALAQQAPRWSAQAAFNDVLTEKRAAYEEGGMSPEQANDLAFDEASELLALDVYDQEVGVLRALLPKSVLSRGTLDRDGEGVRIAPTAGTGEGVRTSLQDGAETPYVLVDEPALRDEYAALPEAERASYEQRSDTDDGRYKAFVGDRVRKALNDLGAKAPEPTPEGVDADGVPTNAPVVAPPLPGTEPPTASATEAAGTPVQEAARSLKDFDVPDQMRSAFTDAAAKLARGRAEEGDTAAVAGLRTVRAERDIYEAFEAALTGKTKSAPPETPPETPPVAPPVFRTRGGFSGKGKGTPNGDGKDQAMRDVAQGAIVQLDGRDRPSSSRTSRDELGDLLAFGPSEVEPGTVVMLARNGSLRGKPLSDEVANGVREAHEAGATFVVGDMPGVDEPFVRLLEEIGADFEVYHSGDAPRFGPSEPAEGGLADGEMVGPNAPVAAPSRGPKAGGLSDGEMVGPNAPVAAPARNAAPKADEAPKAEARDPFEEAYRDVLARQDVEEGTKEAADLWDPLRRAWKGYRDSRQARLTALDARGAEIAVKDNGKEGLATRDETGRVVARSGAQPTVERTLLDMGVARVFRLNRALSTDARGHKTEGSPLSVERVVSDGETGETFYGLDWGETALALYKANRFVVAPVKDSGDVIVGEGLTVPEGRAEVDAETEALLNLAGAKPFQDFSKGELEVVHGDLFHQVKADYQVVITRNAEALQRAGASPEDAHLIARRLWLQNVRYLEAENGGIAWNRMVVENAAGTARHLLDPLDLVKRSQLTASEDPRAELAYQPERVRARGALRMAVARAKDYGVGRVGEVFQNGGAVDHHNDGPVYVRQDVFDGLARDFGLGPDGSFGKPTVATADPELGALFLKGALNRATDAEDALLAGADLDMLVMDTAAKVTGRRAVNAVGVSGAEGSRRLVAHGDAEIAAYDLPVAEVRVNAGVRDAGEKVGKPVASPLQKFSNLGSDRGGQAAKERMDEAYLRPSWAGTRNGDDAFHRALARPTKANLKALEDTPLHEIPASLVWDVFQQANPETVGDFEVLSDLDGVYGVVMSKVLKAEAEDPYAWVEGLDDGVVDSDAAFEAAKAAQEGQALAKRLINLAEREGMLRPATVMRTEVRPYAETLMLAFLRRRALRPEVRVGAFNGVMTPHGLLSGGSLAENGGDALTERVEPGRWYGDEGLRELPVEGVGGKRTTLGALYDEYKGLLVRAGRRTDDLDKMLAKDLRKEASRVGIPYASSMKKDELLEAIPKARAEMATGEADRLAEVEDRLKFLSMRVPADSPSGSRGLLFGGFTGRRGSGMAFHNEEMVAMGGADLDGDKAYVFQNPDLVGRGWKRGQDSPVMSHLAEVRDEWLTELGRSQEPKADVVRDLIDSKATKVDADGNEYSEWQKDLEPWQRGGVAAADGATTWLSGVGAKTGNEALGAVANTGHRHDHWMEAFAAGEKAASSVQMRMGALKRAMEEGTMAFEGAALRAVQEAGKQGKVFVDILSAADPREFREAKRQGVNETADASGGAGLKYGSRDAGAYLGRKAVGDVRVVLVAGGKRTVLYEGPNKGLGEDESGGVSFTQTDLGRDLAELDGLKAGYVKKEGGGREKGDLEQVVDRITALSPAMREGDNLRYRALDRIGALHLGGGKGLVPYLSRSGWETVANSVNRVFGTGKADGIGSVGERGGGSRARVRTDAERVHDTLLSRAAALMGRFSGRAAFQINNRTDTRGLDPKTEAALVEQDVADAVSLTQMTRRGAAAVKAGVPVERIGQLLKVGEDLRVKGSEVWGRARDPKLPKPTADEVDAALTEANDLIASLPEGPERDVVVGAFLSSLKRQVNPKTLELEGFNDWVRRTEGKEPSEVAEKDRDALLNSWWATGRASWAMGLSAVPDADVVRYLREHDDLVKMTTATPIAKGNRGAERRDDGFKGATRTEVEASFANAALGRTDVTPETLALADLASGGRVDPFADAARLGDQLTTTFGDRLLGGPTRAGARRDADRAGTPEEVALAHARLDKAESALSDLRSIFLAHPEAVRNFPQLFAGVTAEMDGRAGRGGIGTTPEVASVQAVEDFVDYFRDWKTGEILTKETPPSKVPRWFYRAFPDTIGEWMRRLDSQPEHVRVWARTGDGVVPVVGQRYRSTKTFLVNGAVAMEHEEDRMREASSIKQAEAWLPYNTLEVKNDQGLYEPGEAHAVIRSAIHRAAVTQAGQDHAAGHLTPEGLAAVRAEYTRGATGESSRDRWNAAKDKTYRLTLGGEMVEMTGRDLYAHVRATAISEGKRNRHEHVALREDAGFLLDGEGKRLLSDKEIGEIVEAGGDPKAKAMAVLNPRVLLDVDVARSLRPLQRAYEGTGKFPRVGNDLLSLLRWRGQIDDARIKVSEKQAEAYAPAVGEDGMTSVADLRAAGLDGEARRRALAMAQANPWRASAVRGEFYFPQLGHDPAIANAWAVEEARKIEGSDLSDKDRAKATARLRKAVQAGTLDLRDVPDSLANDVLKGPGHGTGDVQAFDPGNLRKRSDVPMPGWDASASAMGQYEARLIRGRSKGLYALVADRAVRNFEQRLVEGGADPADVGGFSAFLRNYAQGQVGQAGVVPESWLKGGADAERMNVGAAKMFTTTGGLKGLQALGSKLGLGGKWVVPGKGEEVGSDAWQMREAKVSALARTEAKFTFLSLLGQPKAFFNNLTQTTHTGVSTGWGTWRKSLSMSYLRQNLDGPDFPMRTWEDAVRFAERSGVVEDMFANEIPFPEGSPLAGESYRGFRTALAASAKDFVRTAMRRGEQPSDEALQGHLASAAKRYGVDISDSLMRFGGVFMKKSERAVRVQSYMAHYLNARDVLGATGASFHPEDPHLVRMARRGVEATQFMYNDAVRPFALRGPIGKMAFRFQMWTLQSIRWQRDVYREASRRGFQRGTPEYERFQRMMTYDVLSFQLAAAFGMGLFMTGMPQPVQWAYDAAEFLFAGDEEERGEAFMGEIKGPGGWLAPLNAVTPPGMRYLTTAGKLGLKGIEMGATATGFEALGRWAGPASEISGYEIMSTLPLGLFMRNGYEVAKNPLSAIDRFTGIPAFSISRKAKNVGRSLADEPAERGAFDFDPSGRFGY